MFEQILKHRPKGATHWQAGYYYNSDECGIWSIWENGKWHGDFKFPDGVMTKLPEEKEPAMSEFKVGNKVVLKNSSQDKVMTIQECYKEFIRAYWDDKHYSFAHEVNFRFATPEEIAAGHRIDKPSNPRELETLDKPENHISPNCKVEDV